MRIALLVFMVCVTAAAGPALVAQAGPPQCLFEENAAVAPLGELARAVRARDLNGLRQTLDRVWSREATAAPAKRQAMVDLTRWTLAAGDISDLRTCTRGREIAIGIFRSGLTETADQLVVQTAASPEGGVVLAQIVVATRSFAEVSPTMTPEERVNRFRQYVERLAAADAFSGSVLLTDRQRTVYAGAFGLANRERQVPNTIDTPFNLASLNKLMTSVAALQLVESGSLSLATRVDSILPGVSADPRFAEVTVRHLMTHTSGVDRDTQRLAFAPGTSFLYSNTGYRVLGDVIAAVSRMRFEDYLRLKVLGPSGMTNTGRYEMSAPSPLLTMGYTLQAMDEAEVTVPDWKPNPYLHTIAGGAMGGLFSTAPDLGGFARALLDGRLVSAETLTQLQTPPAQVTLPSYGLGVMFARLPGVWGHGGDLPGADTALEFYNSGYAVVVLANRDNVNQPILQLARTLFHQAPARG